MSSRLLKTLQLNEVGNAEKKAMRVKHKLERAEEQLCSEERGTPWTGPMRKHRCSIRSGNGAKALLSGKTQVWKGKKAVKGDPKKSGGKVQAEKEIEEEKVKL